MSLQPGRSIGCYRVVAPLGAGGMGEVWRATDTRVGRDVAVKVLPATFTTDRERLARFEREARVLGSLNHPNIAHLYGLEQHDDEHFIIMECVEGEDLAARLKRGRIPLDEALEIGRQIARALEEAHEKGIVHRDLKPGNIRVTPDGKVKVLDFGLAKAWERLDLSSQDIGNSPTLAQTGTAVGVILGTAAYMSPEQARGRTVDRRADIWAFGVVLYEMLTGRRLFDGETVSDLLASVLKTEPDWSTLPTGTPAPVRRLLGRCLVRDPRERLHDIADARLEIEEAIAGGGYGDAGTVPPRSSRRRTTALLWSASVLLGAAAGAWAAWSLRPHPTGPVRRFEVPTEDLDMDLGPAVISPDGRRILYVAASTLWVRDLDRVEPRAIVTSSSLYSSFWSPDSQQVAYFSRNKLWRVPAEGGEPKVIASTGFRSHRYNPGGAWLDDGRIVVAPADPGSALLGVSATGGDFAVIHDRDASTESGFRKPSALPGGGILMVVDRRPQGSDTIAVLSRGKRHDLLRLEKEELDAPVYSPSGHVLYWRRSGNAGVWAFPFSLSTLERTGEPFLVSPDAAWPSVSTDGTALISRFGQGRFQLAWVDRQGKVEGIVGNPGGVRGYGNPELSPDGTRIAAMIDDGNGGISPGAASANGGPFTRLTDRNTGRASLGWYPGSSRVAFDSCGASSEEEDCIVACTADGSGSEVRLASGSQPEITPDGRQLVFTRANEDTLNDIYTLALGADGLPVPGARPEPLIVMPNSQTRARVSPDGRLVAYCSNEGGEWNVYVRPFSRGEGRWRASTTGGHWHAWSRDGSRLYWQYDDGLWEAEVRATPSVSIGASRLLFSPDAAGARLDLGFAVSPDDKHFLVVRLMKDETVRPPALALVENWFEEYRTKGRK